jgi:hypothetical protein
VLGDGLLPGSIQAHKVGVVEYLISLGITVRVEGNFSKYFHGLRLAIDHFVHLREFRHAVSDKS